MKGMLYTPENIKAIVDGRKTVTRRLDGLKEINKEPDRWEFVQWKYKQTGGITSAFFFKRDDGLELVIRPRYQVGKVVYIKEAYTYVTLAEKDPWKDRAEKDGSFRRMPDGSPVTMCYKLDGYEIGSDWLNPMFMPAWAARYFIKITDVSAERLREITSDDIDDEGIDVIPSYGRVDAFKRLWDSINPKYLWELNPWCWRYETELVEKP